LSAPIRLHGDRDGQGSQGRLGIQFHADDVDAICGALDLNLVSLDGGTTNRKAAVARQLDDRYALDSFATNVP